MIHLGRNTLFFLMLVYFILSLLYFSFILHLIGTHLFDGSYTLLTSLKMNEILLLLKVTFGAYHIEKIL